MNADYISCSNITNNFICSDKKSILRTNENCKAVFIAHKLRVYELSQQFLIFVARYIKKQGNIYNKVMQWDHAKQSILQGCFDFIILLYNKNNSRTFSNYLQSTTIFL